MTTTCSDPTLGVCTTLRRLDAHKPCRDGWETLCLNLGKPADAADDEPLPLTTILDSNGLDDALWALRAVEGYDREIRLYAVWCARQVQHLMADPRSLAALDVAERHANGLATDEELRSAEAAAWVAWTARGAAADAVAWAASAARAAARAAPAPAARAAADAAADAAAWAASAAARAAADAVAARVAARVAAWATQSAEFRRVFGAVAA